MFHVHCCTDSGPKWQVGSTAIFGLIIGKWKEEEANHPWFYLYQKWAPQALGLLFSLLASVVDGDEAEECDFPHTHNIFFHKESYEKCLRSEVCSLSAGYTIWWEWQKTLSFLSFKSCEQNQGHKVIVIISLTACCHMDMDPSTNTELI